MTQETTKKNNPDNNLTLSNLRISDTYSYLYDLLDQIKHNKPFSIDEVNLAGGRQAGKTWNIITFCLLASLYNLDKTFHFYFIRKVLTNKRNMFEQINKVMPKWFSKAMGISTNITYNSMKGYNFELNVLGITGQKTAYQAQLGLPRTNADYIIIFYEEAYEFNARDFDRVFNATGGSKNSKILIFKASNPWNPSCAYFQDFQNVLPWNEKVMMSKGEDYYFDKKNRTLYHWTCIVKTVQDDIVSPNRIKKMYERAHKNKLEAPTILYGKPMIAENQTFDTSKIIYVGGEGDEPSLIPYNDFLIRVGIDFGQTRNPTAVVFGISNFEGSRILVLDTLTIEHHERAIHTPELTTRILGFIVYNMNLFELDKNETVYVNCDTSDMRLVWDLQSLADKRNIDYLSFSGVKKNSKRFRRSERLMAWMLALGNRCFYMFRNENNKKLIASMQSIVLRPDKKGFVEDESSGSGDDQYDALCYAFSDEIARRTLGQPTEEVSKEMINEKPVTSS